MRKHITKVGAVAMLAILGAAPAAAGQQSPQERARELRREAVETRARAQAIVAAQMQSRGWLGFAYNMPGDERMVIQRVSPGSPAEQAGLEPGDTIVRWNGRTDVVSAAGTARLEPGDTVRLRIRREAGRERDLTVVADRRQAAAITTRPGQAVRTFRRGDNEVIVLDPNAIASTIRLHVDSVAIHADSLHQRLRVMFRDSLAPRLRALEAVELPRVRVEMERAASRAALASRGVAGAELTDVNSGLAAYFRTERGALVLRVGPETPAARAGLQAGDVVVAANGQPIDNARDLREAIARSRDRELRLQIVRAGERQELRMRWD